MINSPNPFDQVSKVEVYLPEPTYLTISIYSSTGVLVDTLFEGPRLDGDHSFTWDAQRQPAGTYLCVLQVGQDRVVNSIVKR